MGRRRRLRAHFKAQLWGVRTTKVIEEPIDIIEVFVPYPIEHKTVWRIQCQRVIAQFRLQWADPHARILWLVTHPAIGQDTAAKAKVTRRTPLEHKIDIKEKLKQS
ncbi:hypothetical protein [Klebsiella aerogenes EA1509E]|nr:hypothetical protein [Klebsiella aerogenes EA1509E]